MFRSDLRRLLQALQLLLQTFALPFGQRHFTRASVTHKEKSSQFVEKRKKNPDPVENQLRISPKMKLTKHWRARPDEGALSTASRQGYAKSSPPPLVHEQEPNFCQVSAPLDGPFDLGPVVTMGTDDA